MSTQVSTQPTHTLYHDSTGAIMAFKWTQEFPRKGAHLGEVSYKQYCDKPIQIYDARSTPEGTDWGYQAQDGEFVCRMFVTADRSKIIFSRSTKGNWPLVTVFVLYRQ